MGQKAEVLCSHPGRIDVFKATGYCILIPLRFPAAVQQQAEMCGEEAGQADLGQSRLLATTSKPR